MQTQLTNNPIEAANRVEELGWTMDELNSVVSSSVRARTSCSPHHPPGAPGFYAWADATATLREIGATKGLIGKDDNHISSTFDEKRKLKFAVCNTGDGTGLDHGIARNNNRKGPGTVQIVADNYYTFDFYDKIQNIVHMPSVGEVVHWYLCIFCDGNEVRAELSSPLMCENGYFTAFRERIFLTIEGHGNDPIKRRDDSPNDAPQIFEINVTRKES